jgi:hypothetical protein
MKSFFLSLKTERTACKLYRTRDEAKADVLDYVERFCNPKTPAFDDWTFESYGVRTEGRISSSVCQRNRVQPICPQLQIAVGVHKVANSVRVLLCI